MENNDGMQSFSDFRKMISESTGRPFSLSIDIKRFEKYWFECAIKYVFFIEFFHIFL